MRVRPAGWVAMGLALLAVLLWAPLWNGEHTLFVRDVQLYFYPMKAHLARAVRAGEWPWWNPWIHNGLPFYANPQVGLFYPPSALFYLLATPLAYNWLVILHYALLSLGFLAWLRRCGRSLPAAGFGALAVTWGGFAVSLGNYLNNLQAVVWIGWIWWAWWRWREEGSARWLAATGGLFALQFLGGEPQITALTALLAVAMAWVWPRDRRGRARWLGPVAGMAAAALVAILLAAVQLVPTVELFLLSSRRAGLATTEALRWSLEPLQLSNLVLPRYFAGAQGLFDMPGVLTPKVPWVFTAYAGVVTTALAAAACGRAHARTVIFWGGLALVGAALALGQHNPLYARLVEAPTGLGFVRYPEKFLLLPALALPVMAAAGLDALLAERAARVRAGAALVAVVLVAVVVARVVDLAWAERALTAWRGDSRAIDARAVVVAYGRALRHVALVAAAAGLLLALIRRLPRWAPAALLALLGLVDLATVNLAAVPVAPSRLFTEVPALLERLPREDLARSTRLRTRPLGSEIHGTFSYPGLAIATQHVLLHDIVAANLGMVYRVLEQDGGDAFQPDRVVVHDEIFRRLPQSVQVRYLRLASTGYVFALEGVTLPGLVALPEGAYLGGRLYRVTDPLPRAYLVGRVGVEPDSIAVLNHFLAEGQDPRRVAYVAEGPGLDGPDAVVDGRIAWLAETNHAQRLSVETPARSLLVVTDNAYPGWRVTVDGRPARIELVNGVFRGVVLEPGRHVVAFDYTPRGVAAAGVVSALALVAVVGVLARGAGRRAPADRAP